MTNPYLDLSNEFNSGRIRAILSSGQAVVVHRLAIMSKDGDWILSEDEETMDHVLKVLDRRDSRYRFGAPLDLRWLRHGWSCHMEHRRAGMRLRTDFVTRPPRVSNDELAEMWRRAHDQPVPVVEPDKLAQIKKTNREKDYVVIGELARLMTDPRSQMLHSRSARELADLARRHPELARKSAAERPVLEWVSHVRERLEEALDKERRTLMRVNERRLAAFAEAAREWSGVWPQVAREIKDLSLLEAHAAIVERALDVLPFDPHRGSS